MGRTTPTVNDLILAEQADLARFRRALRREDRHLFDTLFAYAHKHAAAINRANHTLPFEAMVLAMLLEHARELERLQQRLDG